MKPARFLCLLATKERPARLGLGGSASAGCRSCSDSLGLGMLHTAENNPPAERKPSVETQASTSTLPELNNK